MIIEVEGHPVEVDDSFANLSHEQQQTELQHIISTLPKKAEATTTPQQTSSFGVKYAPELGAIGGGMIGLASGPSVTKSFGELVAPAASKVPGTGVQRYIAGSTDLPFAGGKDYGTAYNKAMVASGQPVQSRGSSVPMRRGAASISNQPAAPHVPLFERGPSAITTPAAPASRLGSGIRLGAAGSLGGKTIQDISEGHYGDAALHGAGSIAALAGQSQYRPLRVLGNIVSGLEAVSGVTPYFNRPEEKADGGVIRGYANLGKVLPAIKGIGQKLDRYKIANAYPDILPPVTAIDPRSKKEFLQKQLSDEALAVQEARKQAQKAIQAGHYDPYFDIEKRFYAEPSRYSLAGTTETQIVPKKQETYDKYYGLASRPESIDRIMSAYNLGKDQPLAKDWYAMGQLEKSFIDALGPEEGAKQFKRRFADAMAATTGGADPNSNLMMAAYTNYMHNLGRDIPTVAYDLPFPIGGRYVSGNMEQAKKLGELSAIPVDNPKRHNFSANFLGYRDRSTIDEQMSKLFDPAMSAPPPNAYGIYEKVFNDLARGQGLNPANMQDVTWAGAKNYAGKPMIQEINEMIARTHMLTGEHPDEIVKGFVKADKPMYANGGKIATAVKNLIIPPAENAARTQIIGTLPTYQKAADIFKREGATGRGIDFGAGLGEGAKVLGKDFHTYEPFAQNWTPTFAKAADVPSDAYGKLTNLNVLNVVPREVRDTIVEDIGRVMQPGGYGIITTRGKDVLNAKGTAGPEPLSIITSRDTYQKGFTKDELEDYMKYILGDKFDVNRLNLGPAGVLIQKKADGGLACLKEGGSSTPAWQRKEGKNPEGGLNAKGRASYNRETGGNLKRPQPEGGKRRDSFCARMKGMKKKLTSAETANDPDSRINKSLRAWNC